MLLIREFIEYVFSIALFINALLFIPQIIRIVKNKTVEGISITTFLGLLLIQFTVVLHGVIIGDNVLIYGYLLSMITCGSVVILALIKKTSHMHLNAEKITLEEIISQLPVHIYWKDRKFGLADLGSNTNMWKNFGINSLNELIKKLIMIFFLKSKRILLKLLMKKFLLLVKLNL